MARCVVCREDILPRTRCRRCRTNNRHLEDVNPLIAYWGSFWGVLSALLVLPPLLMLMPGIYGRVNEMLQPVASVRVGGPFALLSTAGIAFYVYSLRDALHHHERTLRFKEKPWNSIAFWALAFFVVAFLLAFILSFGLANKGEIVAALESSSREEVGALAYGSSDLNLLKLMMTSCLILVFVFLALATGLMAAYLYGQYIDEHRPDPIFLNERRLIKLVLPSVKAQLGIDTNPVVSGMHRRQDGGIALDLHHRGELITEGSTIVREDQTWSVEADCWGRVRKVEAKGLRLVEGPKVDATPPAGPGPQSAAPTPTGPGPQSPAPTPTGPRPQSPAPTPAAPAPQPAAPTPTAPATQPTAPTPTGPGPQSPAPTPTGPGPQSPAPTPTAPAPQPTAPTPTAPGPQSPAPPSTDPAPQSPAPTPTAPGPQSPAPPPSAPEPYSTASPSSAPSHIRPRRRPRPRATFDRVAALGPRGP